ncbi:phosphatidylglycerol:prolipoprotein diacylglycerol transferase [Thermodesulfitimonas autotrophica]|uniref:Phosphatidylglycerol--prolipoprotein diacylglyceryl transferase n=1 Tax=Thermodesulfitimonas autotrophica TaxID=1894989 RepID=A0A3N5AY57_9THEO|nr:prolipoprotein diacylglyceryl transferase [Thermodesulfitimonas autotrophica]RPF49897.1 phosphatidylglycerol:prolipoprotein diacylglycerol transferase [Thermodesulfitimonas autotrophica]
MWPVLFHIGNFAVHSYGVMLAVAVLVGLLAGEREAKRRGIDPDFVLNLTILLVVGGIIGSRIAYVLIEWPYFAAHPQEIVRVWDGGLSFYGAVIVAVPLMWLYGRRGGLRFGDIADVAAFGAAAGYPFARIGCFLNGCCYGKPTTVPWAVAFPFDGVPRHPTQLYAVLLGALIFGALLYFRRRQRFAGQLAILYLIFYSAYRFFIDFFRVSPPAGAYLTLGQVASLLVAGAALVVLAVKWRGTRP